LKRQEEDIEQEKAEQHHYKNKIMNNYITTYEKKNGDIEEAEFTAENIKQAKVMASNFKRHNPQLKNSFRTTRLKK